MEIGKGKGEGGKGSGVSIAGQIILEEDRGAFTTGAPSAHTYLYITPASNPCHWLNEQVSLFN